MADKDTRSPEEKGIDAARSKRAAAIWTAQQAQHPAIKARLLADALDGFDRRCTVADRAATIGRGINGVKLASKADKPSKPSKPSKASKGPTVDTVPAPSV